MKKFWQTSEFWLSVAAVCLSIVWGVFDPGGVWDKAAGLAAAALAAAGYSVSRGLTKLGAKPVDPPK